MTPDCLDIVFRGRVQGVGFRARAAAAAARCGVRGWVRNEPDGTVRCIAEGDPAATSSFIESLLNEMSRYIERHDVQTLRTADTFSSFEVRY